MLCSRWIIILLSLRWLLLVFYNNYDGVDVAIVVYRFGLRAGSGGGGQFHGGEGVIRELEFMKVLTD
jgi:hypothetical protein